MILMKFVCNHINKYRKNIQIVINDVKEISAVCLADPAACDKGSAAVYGMAQSLPDRSIVDQITRAYLDSLYAIKSLQ